MNRACFHVRDARASRTSTYGQLRGERRAHQEAERRERHGLPTLDDRPVITEAQWTLIRTGLAYGERLIVDSIRREQQPACYAWEGGVRAADRPEAA
jgi:hypothetical protein